MDPQVNKQPGNGVEMEQFEQEIIETETAFAALALEKGLQIAFVRYAAQDAVLNRNGRLIVGKQAIEAFYGDPEMQKVRLTWKPDFVGASASGDLGYTYGKYSYESVDEDGKEVKFNGIFHTVWKRQANGTWRYVWD
jgi:ketosteroid isomerase-like protein